MPSDPEESAAPPKPASRDETEQFPDLIAYGVRSRAELAWYQETLRYYGLDVWHPEAQAICRAKIGPPRAPSRGSHR